jgi:hypothetical protein
VKLSPGTPGGAIQLAGGAPSKIGVGCARAGVDARMPTTARTLDLMPWVIDRCAVMGMG